MQHEIYASLKYVTLSDICDPSTKCDIHSAIIMILTAVEKMVQLIVYCKIPIY
jgi:hypothetical protein